MSADGPTPSDDRPGAADDLADLVRRAAAGDRDAQSELAVRVERPVRTIVHRRIPADLRRRMDTDDVLQSTLAIALAELHRVEYRGERQFIGWLAAVAERQVVAAARRHRAGRRDVGREDGEEPSSSVPGGVTQPSLRASRHELEARVREAMSRLPEDERTALELRTEKQLSFTAIAARMGLSDKHAARRLHGRAMANLAARLGEV